MNGGFAKRATVGIYEVSCEVTQVNLGFSGLSNKIFLPKMETLVHTSYRTLWRFYMHGVLVNSFAKLGAYSGGTLLHTSAIWEIRLTHLTQKRRWTGSLQKSVGGGFNSNI